MEQVLGRIRTGVVADEDRRLAGIDDERLLPRGVLLICGIELADRRAVVRAVDPAVVRAELELRELRIRLDGVERPEQLRRVDAVANALGRCAHAVSFQKT